MCFVFDAWAFDGRHDIWMSENLKFDYFKNEKSFRSEIKNIFHCFTSALFRHMKQTNKNVADTIDCWRESHRSGRSKKGLQCASI